MLLKLREVGYIGGNRTPSELPVGSASNERGALLF